VSPDLAHGIQIQRQMVRDLHTLGWERPCGRHAAGHPAAGAARDLGAMFDHYSLALLVLTEAEARIAQRGTGAAQ